MAVAQDVLDIALELPESDRAMIAHRLLLSLEPAAGIVGHEEWESAWSEEIQRRREEIRAGRAKFSTWPEAKARLLEALTAAQNP